MYMYIMCSSYGVSYMHVAAITLGLKLHIWPHWGYLDIWLYGVS